MGLSTQRAGLFCHSCAHCYAAIAPGDTLPRFAPPPSVGTSAGQGHAQYWYQRAHRALKQRASEPLQLMREYQHVVALDHAITHPCSVAKSRAAAGRNRYTNVLPYDYNRCARVFCVSGLQWACSRLL